MKKITLAMAAATFALGVLTTNAYGDENDVSPLLAKKAAVYAIMHGTEAKWVLVDQGYKEFFLSDAIEFYDYNGERKYYLFYYAYGTDRLPTWKEMEDTERAREFANDIRGGRVRWLYLRATKRMKPKPPEMGGGTPPGISGRFACEGILKNKFPGKKVTFVKMFGTGAAVSFFVYEFVVGGEPYIIGTPTFDSKKLSELKPEPPWTLSDDNKAKWDEIDAAIPDEEVKGPKIVIDEMKMYVPILGKSVNSYNQICGDVPNYYQYGQGAPWDPNKQRNNWGCGTVSASSVAGGAVKAGLAAVFFICRGII